jgi:hypothetical protein
MAIHPAHFLNTAYFHRFPHKKKSVSFHYILLQYRRQGIILAEIILTGMTAKRQEVS